MTSVRLAAARVLVAVERGRTTLAAEIERGRADLGMARDRGLLLELVAGTLRWQNALDAQLNACSRRPMARIDPHVRATLRIAAYQLLELERVPDHAAVHEAVETVKALGLARAAGFVNAVLRALVRTATPPLPARPATVEDRRAALEYLSVALSHPRWLVDRWLDRYGFDATETWCRFNNDAPEVSIRPAAGHSAEGVLGRLLDSGIAATRGHVLPDVIRLPAGSFGRLDSDIRALVTVQDEGSQLVARAVGARPGERVLDVCAAPGGKTVVLGTAMRGKGLLVASDVRPNRVALLRASISRAALPASLVALDATSTLPFSPVFDRVLVDVPCSGLGTLRRDPDLKWSRRAGDLPALAANALRILEQASQVVRPGGRLVYATCSSEPDENEAVVESFLARNETFAAASFEFGNEGSEAGRVIDARGFLRTLPFRDGLDAYFAAALARRARPRL
jgi:16S rRNA (cytosine967-C5)-methyltransferase